MKRLFKLRSIKTGKDITDANGRPLAFDSKTYAKCVRDDEDLKLFGTGKVSRGPDHWRGEQRIIES